MFLVIPVINCIVGNMLTGPIRGSFVFCIVEVNVNVIGSKLFEFLAINGHLVKSLIKYVNSFGKISTIFCLFLLSLRSDCTTLKIP